MNQTGSDPGDPENAAVDPRRLVAIIFAGKWLILGSVLVVGVGATAWTLRQPKVYEAECVIEYDPQPPRPMGTGVEEVGGESEYWLTREFFETQNEVITSRRVSEIIVTQLQLQHDPEFMDVPERDRQGWRGAEVSDAAMVLQGKLDVLSDDETRLVRVRVRDQNPERAAMLANGVADAYIARTVESRSASTLAALTWLATQLDELGSELAESELALHEFKQEHHVLSVSLEDRQNLVANEVRVFHEELSRARAERVALEAAFQQLREAGRGDPMDMPERIFEESRTIERLRRRIEERSAEGAALEPQYGDAHPRMLAIDREIEELRVQLRRAVDSFVAASEIRLRAADQRIGRLNDLLAEASERGLDLNLEGIDYERLHRDRESNERLYNLVLQRTSETNLTATFQTTHAAILDRALTPSTYVSPVVSTNIFLGVLAGLFIGFFLTIIRDRLRRTVITVEDAEELGLPILGIFPRSETTPRARRQGFKRTARGSPMAPVEEADLVAHHRPMSIAAECCKTIRTNLMLRSGVDPLTMLVVTSANSEEGKTTVAANIAVTIAQSGKRVLLVDADLRRPRLHRLFDVAAAPGLTALLSSEVDLEGTIVPTMVARLDLIPAGARVPNPSELLHAESLPRMLAALSERYDVVIFDSPPIGPVTDAAILAAEVGRVLLLVKAESTTRDGLEAALRQLTDVGAEIVGGVLNWVDLRGGPYRYYHYRRYGRAGYYTYPPTESADSDREDRERTAG